MSDLEETAKDLLKMEDKRKVIMLSDIILETIQREDEMNERLAKNPGGYEFEPGKNGGVCQFCGYVTHGVMWYDKHGFRCMTCQEAHKQRIIPGYVLSDHKNETYLSRSQVKRLLGLTTQQLQSKILSDELKARTVKHDKYPDTMIFIRKENPQLDQLFS